MELATRQLIYVSRHPCAELYNRFHQRGWQVEVAASAREASRAARDRGATGGLLDLSSAFPAHEIAAFEAPLTLPHVGWVATATAGQLGDSGLRRLVRDYCFDYVTVPSSGERIVDSVGHAFGMAVLADPLASQGQMARSEGEMVGSCEPMLQLFRLIRKVALTDAPVFISGESGTGKELTAVAIHERSIRRQAPFVAINCGAIPPHLLQSELFGYERGAFTGANQRKIGRIEAAHGGTLFLDEIGDLALESQASLLRFLQESKVERLGGHGSVDVDVRIISATHVDLQAAMRDGRFRPDLYHRLCVLQLDEPPLRARGKDIELLARHMLERFRKDTSRRVRGFTPDAIAALHNYPWPGNVRELINRVRRALVMSDTRALSAADLELADYVATQPVSLAQAREAAERQAIERALLRHRGRFSEAASELGISRVTLYRLLCAHGMRQDEGAPPELRDLPAGVALQL
ncbi:sigma-54 dependent transcriptional regulator [Paraburkholderia bonniea]|uniref:sigma-54 dependent transcriptional regulator n=1 Tax=Paraburkholderia bonniea TaxID=2152891 RepID=UPI001291A7E5|nr:sigma-54 dependent transcriptional regulator [Paraburkholderia bonniea]